MTVTQPELTGITPVVIEDDESHVVQIAIGLSAAYLAYRWFVKPRLAEHRPRTPEEANSAATLAVRGARKVWSALARPAVLAAYTAAGGDKIPYPAVERLAQAYVDELGDYVDSTSVGALTEGFTAQISNGWGEGIAWTRASEGFGLDARQMRSYLSGLMAQDRTKYISEPIPPQVVKKVESAVLTRADKLGMNESRKAVQLGKNMVWMAMAAQGDLPPGTMKKWVTAEDERVCEVCGPLDQVTIPLHQQFISGDQKFYAPSVHPNCRCNLEIVYPPLDIVKKDMGDDEYDRNRKGQFWFREERVKTKEKVELVGDTKEKVNLVGDVRSAEQVFLKAPTKPILVGQERANLVGETRAVLRPIEAVVEDVTEVADEAVAAEGKPLKVWDEPVYMPAYMALKREQPSWLNEYFGNLVGRHIRLDAATGYTIPDTTGRKEMSSEAFYNAAQDDAPMATLTAVGRNREAQQHAGNEMGGVAQSAGIAPGVNIYGVTEEEYEFIREAMGGLTHKQLLNAAESALRNPDATNPLLYLEADPMTMSTEDMLGWMETLDATTLASEIFTAYHAEQRAIANGYLKPTDTAWTNIVEVIKDAAVHGDKKGIFDYGNMGQTNVEKAPLYMFRINKWLGDKPPNNMFLADTELAEVSGIYQIVRAHQATLPVHVQTDLVEHGKHDMDVYEAIDTVIILDLEPVGLTQTGMTDEGR